MADSKKKWTELVTRAKRDGAFKERLLKDPGSALRELGIETPVGVDVRVVENTERVQYIVLPSGRNLQDLPAENAADVRGGGMDHKIGLAPSPLNDIFGGGAAAKAFRVGPSGGG